MEFAAHGRAIKLNPLQEDLSDAMVATFSRPDTITTRNPKWKPFRGADGNLFSLALGGSQMTLGRSATDHHCEFWNKSGLY
jgi:hypothetical protein